MKTQKEQELKVYHINCEKCIAIGKAQALAEEIEFLTGNSFENICNNGKKNKNCCICRRLKELRAELQEIK